MATDKSFGELGFRNLHGFNIALLRKHICKLCQNPTSLVARDSKARYFADEHILQAEKGSYSSFIRIGIWEAKETLYKGFRWVLDNGKAIRIFKDQWLRGKIDSCVEDLHMNNISDEKVCQFICPNSKDWDVHKVQHNFLKDDIQLNL